MTTNFELTSGRNRALVCYCATTQLFDFARTINSVFNDAGIQTDSASNGAVYGFPDSTTALNIALSWGETSRRLRVGGSFVDVCVGVFFYNAPQPIDTRGTMAEVNEFFGEEVAPEPPSITSLVCDAMCENFGGVYGASSFVIPNTETSFALEVE